MVIVEEIVNECKTILDTFLVGYTRADYEFNEFLNSERGSEKVYGFIPGPATFAEGRAMGFTTMNHVFTLKLIDQYQSKDDDSALRTSLFYQYGLVQESLKQLQKSKIALPTPTNQVLLISGLSLDEPEVSPEDCLVILRANFTIQYRYQNI